MTDSLRALGVSLLGLAVAGCSLSAPARSRADALAASALGNVLTARYAELADDAPIAADRLFRALEAAPNDEALLDRAVGAALAANDVERAIEAARLSDRVGASSGSARFVLGVAALDGGRAAEATKRLESPPASVFERLASQTVRAHALSELGRTEEALTLLTSENRSADLVLSFSRGMVQEKAGQNELALQAYAVAGGDGVGLAPAVERHVRLLARLGRLQEARSVAEASLARVSNPAIAALTRQLDAGLALHDGDHGVRQDAAASLFAISIAFLSSVEPMAATPYLALAAKLDPKSDVVRLALAESLTASGLSAQADAVLEATPEGSPYRGSALAQRAELLQADNRIDEAAALLQAAAGAGDPRARRALADIYRSQERWVEAAALYAGLAAEAEAAGRPDWRLYFSLGAARERMGKWPEAEADLRRALKIEPDQPEVLNYLGYTWVDRGERLEEGFALIERAVALRPQAGHIVDSLGWAYFKMGEYDVALTHLERAASLSPDDVTINDHLGDAYWRLGRRIEARFQWRRALSLKPTGAERQSLEGKLAAGLPPLEGPAVAGKSVGPRQK